MQRAILAVVLLSGTALAGSKSPLPITTCGQHVAKWQVGVLQNDIQCPGSFVCRPGCSDVFPCDTQYQPTIYCTPDCSGPNNSCRSTECPNPTTDFCVLPPGGAFVVGVDVESGGEVELNGHTLAGAYYGIVSYGLVRHLSHLTVRGPGSVTGSQVAVSAGKVQVSDATFTGNVNSIGSESMKVADVTITGGSGLGLFAPLGGKATNTTVTGATWGVYSTRSFSLVDSSIAGNGTDVLTARRPRLARSMCDTSARLVPDSAQPGQFNPEGNWAVCAND